MLAWWPVVEVFFPIEAKKFSFVVKCLQSC